jgi:hypothetical protein
MTLFSDALDRETAWLATIDSLGDLTAQFQIIQARFPRTPSASQTALYVCRKPNQTAEQARFATQRIQLIHNFDLRLHWPMTSGTGAAEADQLAFDQAIDVVIARITGPISDKSHGGRFSWVAEDPSRISIDVEDPEISIGEKRYQARITYQALDTDLPG